MMDGVPSKVNVLLQIVSYPLLKFFLQKVSNPGHCSYCSWKVSNHVSCSFYGKCPILSHWHQKLQEDEIGTLTGIGYCSLGLLMSSSVWCRKDKSWSRHQKLQEDWLGTKDEIGSSNSSLLYLLIHASICIARGEGGTEVISISLCLYLVSLLVP